MGPRKSSGGNPKRKGRAACVRFARQVAEGSFYRGLGTCRTLIELEDAATAPADEAA